MAFNPISNPVDFVELAGRRTPGIAEVLGASSPREWKERRSIGYGGAIVVFRGIKLARFTVKLRLYSDQDWQDWDDFRDVVQRPPLSNAASQGVGIIRSPFGRRPKALSVNHPILADLNISSCVVLDVLQPVQTGNGEWTIDIKFIEYRRPRYQLATPDAAATTDVPTKGERENADAVENVTVTFVELTG